MVQPDRGWRLLLHGHGRATWDSNIFITPSDEQSDFYFTLAPGVTVGRGDFRSEMRDAWSFRERFERDRKEDAEDINHVFLTYMPSVTKFVDHSEEDTFDHDVLLAGEWEIKRLTLGVHARFQTLNLPDPDVSERVERNIFNAAITSHYNFSGKTSFELNAYNSIRDYETRVDITEWRLAGWINYQVLPKITASAGITGGYVDVSSGPSQNYEQALVRLRYYATEKLRLLATAGVELRHFDDDTSDQTNWVFSVAGDYSPFDGTYTSLQAYRRTQSSASAAGLNYTLTGFDAQVRQRFLQKYYFRLAGGYQFLDYDAYGSDATAPETHIYYLRPSFGFDFSEALTFELGVEFRKNDSNVERRTYDQVLAFLQAHFLF